MLPPPLPASRPATASASPSAPLVEAASQAVQPAPHDHDGVAGVDGHSAGDGDGDGDGHGNGAPRAAETATPRADLVYTAPLLFQHGMFAGKRMRFSLELAQQPVVGRRKTEKDRRPIAHCPILRLHALECVPSGPSHALNCTPVDVLNIEPVHLLCAAELSLPDHPSRSAWSYPSPRAPSSSRPDSCPVPNSNGDSDPVHGVREYPPFTAEPITRPPWAPATSARPGPSTAYHHYHHTSHPSPYLTVGPSLLDAQPRGPPTTGGVSATGDSHGPVTSPFEESRNLYGSLHVTGVRVPAVPPDRSLGIWFIFTDLTVRHEGTYALRFRVFDMSAIDSEEDSPKPYLAECESQSFQVYSPRNFPGLPRPTEVAEHFSRLGFKLNTRKNERQAKSSGASPRPRSEERSSRPTSPPASTRTTTTTTTTTTNTNTNTTPAATTTQAPHLPDGTYERSGPADRDGRPEAKPLQRVHRDDWRGAHAHAGHSSESGSSFAVTEPSTSWSGAGTDGSSGPIPGGSGSGSGSGGAGVRWRDSMRDRE